MQIDVLILAHEPKPHCEDVVEEPALAIHRDANVHSRQLVNSRICRPCSALPPCSPDPRNSIRIDCQSSQRYDFILQKSAGITSMELRLRSLLILVSLTIISWASAPEAKTAFEYNNIAFREGQAFTFPVPGNLRSVSWSWTGSGMAGIAFAACRVPTTAKRSGPNGMLLTDTAPGHAYPAIIREFSLGQRPDLQDCRWGAYVGCLDQNGCSGIVTITWEQWENASETPNKNTPGDVSRDLPPEAVPEKPTPPARDIGDAGLSTTMLCWLIMAAE